MSKGKLLGSMKMDLWNIYKQDDRGFLGKYAVLQKNNQPDVLGFIKV